MPENSTIFSFPTHNLAKNLSNVSHKITFRFLYLKVILLKKSCLIFIKKSKERLTGWAAVTVQKQVK